MGDSGVNTNCNQRSKYKGGKCTEACKKSSEETAAAVIEPEHHQPKTSSQKHATLATSAQDRLPSRDSSPAPVKAIHVAEQQVEESPAGGSLHAERSLPTDVGRSSPGEGDLRGEAHRERPFRRSGRIRTGSTSWQADMARVPKRHIVF